MGKCKDKRPELSQLQLFWQAHRKTADANAAFLDMVKGGLTSGELRKLIYRRPLLWERFSNWLVILPASRPAEPKETEAADVCITGCGV